MTGRKRCSIDASILLDFVAGDIFETLFSLPFEFSTSDIVADEVSNSFSTKDLKTYGIELVELDEELVDEIGILQGDHEELSPNDLSVYVLAKKHKAILVSGDGPLRTLADITHVEYHGTLWLLDELVKRDLISTNDAAHALMMMLDNKRWLPRSECEKLIKKWKSED
jgi:predicted nucleic acid-binding protein